MYLFIFFLNDFDEVLGVIFIVFGIIFDWYDFCLIWMLSNYGDIEMLFIFKKKFWVLSVFLINFVNKMEVLGNDDYLGRVYYSGVV